MHKLDPCGCQSVCGAHDCYFGGGSRLAATLVLEQIPAVGPLSQELTFWPQIWSSLLPLMDLSSYSHRFNRGNSVAW